MLFIAIMIVAMQAPPCIDRTPKFLDRSQFLSWFFFCFQSISICLTDREIAFGLQDVIPTSLLKLSADNVSRAVKMFAGVQKFMEEPAAASVGSPSKNQRLELVQKLLHQVCVCVSGLFNIIQALLGKQKEFSEARQCGGVVTSSSQNE